MKIQNPNPKGYNIIGDIAGNYNTLQALLAKMPDGATPVSCGDMVDRGPQSADVSRFFMKNGLSVKGNHEHMMIDHVRGHEINGDVFNFYDYGVWLYNGGAATLRSFEDAEIDKDIIDWIDGLPLYIQFDGAILTHAPLRGDFTLEQCLKIGCGFTRGSYYVWAKHNPDQKRAPSTDDCVLWHRGTPQRNHKADLGLQIHGHNSYKEVEKFSDDKGMYSICVDTYRGGKLSGIHWPSGELFEQEFLPGDGTNV